MAEGGAEVTCVCRERKWGLREEEGRKGGRSQADHISRREKQRFILYCVFFDLCFGPGTIQGVAF